MKRKKKTKGKNFVNIGILVAQPPANQNRGEGGEIKTIRVGGEERVRISSQCQKRSMRMSEEYQEFFEAFKLTGANRSRVHPRVIFDKFFEQAKSEGKEKLLAKACLIIAKVITKKEEGKIKPIPQEDIDAVVKFADDVSDEKSDKKGDKKKKKDLLSTEILFLSKMEHEYFMGKVKECLEVGKVCEKEIREDFPSDPDCLDISLCGRFCAGSSTINTVESALSVAHAIGVSNIESTDDYFVAVDDFNKEGCGHLNTRQMSSNVLYLNFVINLETLRQNMEKDKKNDVRSIVANLLPLLYKTPTGHKTQDAGFVLPSFFVVGCSNKPMNFSGAFINSINEANYSERNGKNEVELAIDALNEYIIKQKEMYEGDYIGALELDVASLGADEFVGKTHKNMSSLIKWVEGFDYE